jgi:phospholipid/cholesterol/gamma-HCH transport system permease protein
MDFTEFMPANYRNVQHHNVYKGATNTEIPLYFYSVINAIFHFGRYLKLLGQFFRSPERFSVYWKLVMQEMVSVGVGSIVIVIITSVFIGAVTTVQTAYQLVSGFIPRSAIGSVVAASALLELAPTITSLVLAGKVGSHIASQLGTMRVTEQIDAIEVMGINSVSYLIMPKVVGSILAFPMLVSIAAFLIILGGIVAGDWTGQVTMADFAFGARGTFESFQVVFMLIKAVTFGFLISSIAAYQGFYVRGGALEVGQASTRAVVFSCILVLVADYVLAQLLL